MDTSPEYINMCRMAHELQEMWNPEDGDFFAIEHRGEVSVGSVHSCESEDIIPRGEWFIDTVSDSMDCDECTTFWLPRLDQLIELSGMTWHDFLFGVVEYQHIGVDESTEVAAMYELMRVLYDKAWNGEDWI